MTGETINSGERKGESVHCTPYLSTTVHDSPPFSCSSVHLVSFWYALSPVGRRCQVVGSQPAKLSLTCRLQVLSDIAFTYVYTNIGVRLAYRVLNNI